VGSHRGKIVQIARWALKFDHILLLPPPSERPATAYYGSTQQAMAGLGRRTHYRKHLTDSVLNDLPEPSEHEQVARVVSTRGGNHFDICLAHDETVYLAILPTKFHKLVWVKRGDYVLVEVGDSVAQDIGDEDQTRNHSDDDGGIRHMITHILYKDQVKHLKSKGLWPEDDPEFAKGSGSQESDDYENVEGNDGIVYQDYNYNDDEDDDLFVNTNRIARLEIQESSDEESTDEER
jgi:probable RNA-binding protein EIF1AD